MIEPNLFFWIVLAAVVGIYLLDTISEWLNLSALKPELPEDFSDVFDSGKYAKSQEYTRVTTRFGFVESGVGLAVFLAFWLLGGFGWLDGLVSAWSEGTIVRGLAFFGLLYAGGALISLPFELYDTFKIEARFGFNKTTLATFFSDKLKGLVLAVALGAPLLSLLLWLFEAVPNAWLWGWLVVTAFSLLMAYLAPAVILPMFNKFEPLEEGELKEEIESMAAKCEFPLTELSVMDGSKRSSKSNAFFTGFGKNKKIALYDTLVENHTTPELVAVLAHEIGHFKKKHVLQMMVLSFAQTAVLFFLLGFFVNSEPLSAAFGVTPPKIYCSFLFFAMLFKPVSKVLSVLMSILSRKNEFEADAYAADVTGGSGAMVTALKKLSADNLANLTPHPFYVFMHYSHPPMVERLAALRAHQPATAP